MMQALLLNSICIICFIYNISKSCNRQFKLRIYTFSIPKQHLYGSTYAIILYYQV